MTAQVPDILFIRGKEQDLFCDPIYEYIKRLRKDKRPAFRATSTSCYRGYVATWGIRDGMLWLDALEAVVERDGAYVDVDLAGAFPRLPRPAPAVWFSGDLRCPEGELLVYRHAGFASTYERDRMFWVQKGRVKMELLRINPPPAVEYLIEPDGTRHPPICDGVTLADPYGPEETPRGRRWWAAEADLIEASSGGDDLVFSVAAALTLPLAPRD